MPKGVVLTQREHRGESRSHHRARRPRRARRRRRGQLAAAVSRHGSDRHAAVVGVRAGGRRADVAGPVPQAAERLARCDFHLAWHGGLVRAELRLRTLQASGEELADRDARPVALAGGRLRRRTHSSRHAAAVRRATSSPQASSASSFLPSYGLAEHCLAVSRSRTAACTVDLVDGDVLVRESRAVPVVNGSPVGPDRRVRARVPRSRGAHRGRQLRAAARAPSRCDCRQRAVGDARLLRGRCRDGGGTLMKDGC